MKPQAMIDEYLALGRALYPNADIPTLKIVDGLIEFRRGRQWFVKSPPRWFQTYMLSPMRKRAEATHEWWMPGTIDQVCRRCGAIRGVGKTRVCR
jgi:hypothetical protein